MEKVLGLSGKFSFPRMSESLTGGDVECNQVPLGKFGVKEDVEMFHLLSDYYDFSRRDLPAEAGLSAIPTKIYGNLNKP